MKVLWQDLRYAVRMLAKSPAFTLVAVVSLAVGMGANTAIFSVANRILFQPLAVSEPGELLEVHKHTTETVGQGFSVSYPDYEFFREHNEVFAGLLCWGNVPLSLGGERAEQAYGMIVSGNYFDVLGVRAARGRFFAPEEDRTPGTHLVAVLSHGLWRRRFGGDPSIVGQQVTLNGQRFNVIGVAPQNFNSTVPVYAPDVWVPLMAQKQLLAGSGDMLSTRDSRWLQMVGRLRHGVSAEQAEAQLGALALALDAPHPEEKREEERAELLGVTLVPVGSLPTELWRSVVALIGLLLAVAGLVLLIACANLSSLLLARATVRRKEIAVRLALGAGRWRLVRQLLTESVLLCVLSGAVGVLLALWMTDLLLAFKPSMPVPLDLSFPLDWRVLAGTFALSLTTGVLFGLLPALQASGQDLTGALKDGASPGRGGRRRSRARDLFVVGQVALSLLLLVSAGLLLRALGRAQTIFPGADPEQVLTVTLDPGLLGYDEVRARDFYARILERVEGMHGVESVSLADGVPVGKSYAMGAFTINGSDSMSGINHVSPKYFQTMHIPLLRGRAFGDADVEGAPRVAVIDETLARRFFPGEDPIGKHLSPDLGPRVKRASIEIVGVVKGGEDKALGWQPHFFIYLPAAQPLFGEGSARRLILHVRTDASPAEVFAGIRREVVTLDPEVPLLSTMPLTEHMKMSLLPERVGATIAGVFGLVGVALAAIGIFGLLSYSVTQRTREIGVRMALGAQQRDVRRMILLQGLKVTLAGVVVGLVAAFAVTRLLVSLLFGVSATDPLVYGGVSALLIFVALLACYIPARRATKVDPMVALRYE